MIMSSVSEAQTVIGPDELDAALSSAAPGDEIVLRDGTYDNLYFSLAVDGEADRPITIRAETLGGVTLHGNDTRVRFSANYWVFQGFRFEDIQFDDSNVMITFRGASHNTFRDNEVVRCGQVPEGPRGIIRITNTSQHNVIERNRFENLFSLGIQVWSWDDDAENSDNVIRFNYFLDHDASELIQIGQGHRPASDNAPVYRTIVESNLFENIGYLGELFSIKTSGNFILFNTFVNCDDQVVMRNGHGTLVEGNFFFDSRGVRVHDEDHIIRNNYFEGYSRDDDNAIDVHSGNYQRPDVGNGSHYRAVSTLIEHNTIIDPGENGIALGRNHGYSSGGMTWDLEPLRTIVRNNVVAVVTPSPL